MEGTFARKEDAAQAFDLLAKLKFEDQLDGVHGILNDLPNQDQHIQLEDEREDRVLVWQVCEIYLVIHKLHIVSLHNSLSGAAGHASQVVWNAKERKIRRIKWVQERHAQLEDQVMFSEESNLPCLKVT